MCLCGEYKVYRKGAREQGGGCYHLKNGVDLVATNEVKRTRGQVEPAGCAALCTSVHLDWIQEGEFPTLQGRIETKGKRVHARGISQQMVHTQEGEREFHEAPQPLTENVVYKISKKGELPPPRAVPLYPIRQVAREKKSCPSP